MLRRGKRNELIVRHPRRLEPGRHLRRGFSAAAMGDGRIGLDQFLVEPEERLLIRAQFGQGPARHCLRHPGQQP